MVKRGLNLLTGEPVAVAVARQNQSLNPAHQTRRTTKDGTLLPWETRAANVQQEVAVLKACSGLPHILPFYGYARVKCLQLGVKAFVVTALADGTWESEMKKLPADDQGKSYVQWVCDVLQGFEALHQKGYVHRDAHRNNIFIKDGRALLADFSRATTPATPQLMQRDYGIFLKCTLEKSPGRDSRIEDVVKLLAAGSTTTVGAFQTIQTAHPNILID